jgi:hypothetical protein
VRLQIYHAKFKAYVAAMKKLQSDYVITKSDTLGMEEAAATGGSSGGTGLFAALTSKKVPGMSNPAPGAPLVPVGNPHAGMNGPASLLPDHAKRLFTLAYARDQSVFGDLQRDSIIAHVAAQANQRFTYERVFRSQQRLLMDSALTEWSFLCEFFGRGQR